MVGARVGGADRCDDAPRQFLLESDRRAERPRVPEVLVEHEYPGLERGTRRRRWQEVAVRRWRSENRNQCAVPENRLTARAIGAPAARQVEAGDSGVEDSGIGSDQRPAIAFHVIGKPQSRLEHGVVAGNCSIAGELEGSLGIGDRLTDKRSVKQIRYRGDEIGLDLGLPAQPVVHRELRRGPPAVLEEERQLMLNDGLGPCLIYGESANA